jgi:hypothetical protein
LELILSTFGFTSCISVSVRLDIVFLDDKLANVDVEALLTASVVLSEHLENVVSLPVAACSISHLAECDVFDFLHFLGEGSFVELVVSQENCQVIVFDAKE